MYIICARTFIGLEYKSQGIKMVFRLTGIIYHLNSRTTITTDIRYMLFFCDVVVAIHIWKTMISFLSVF